MMLAPILLFVYNRPAHAKRAIEALLHNTLAAESELFIYSDAARSPEDCKSVNEVRSFIHSVNGFKKVHIIEREKNYGLARSIIDGVTTQVNAYGRTIVLEDDLVTAPYFLQFMNSALEMYKDVSRAILEMLFYTDFEPDIINCNDWQTALTPVYLNLYYRHLDKFSRIKTVFTIHNIAYQGKYGLDILEDTCGIGARDAHVVEYDGCANFMKGAIECADKVTTVSPTYAQEILDPWFSHGLDGLLRQKQYKLCGILNGIDVDVFNPATDPDIAKNYDAETFQDGKAACKAYLQDEFGLHKDGSPVMAMVTRLVGHKGVDLVQAIAEGLLQQGIELVVLGSGEAQYENFFNELCARNPGRVGVYIGFNAKLAQEIYAGADMFLMPSRSEPCGLAQMVSCRYGTIPIIRETGGLKDSIRDSGDGYGNGFTFANYNAHELYEACWRAKEGYWQKDGWPVLVKRAMECDFSWSNSAKSYEGLYNEVVNLW